MKNVMKYHLESSRLSMFACPTEKSCRDSLFCPGLIPGQPFWDRYPDIEYGTLANPYIIMFKI